MISKQPEHIEIDHLTPSGHYLSDTLKEILSAAYSKAANLQGIRSFLILKSNKIVAEKYFGSYRLDSLDHVRSVTKSVLSILAGIAYDQGFIKNLDDPIGDYLTIHGLTKPQRLITIRNLLTMSGGMDWDGSINEFNDWVMSSNHLKKTLGKDVVETPGTKFNYNPGDPYLVAMLITDATGMTIMDFGQKYLFGPLGIDQLRWPVRSGYYDGNAGLELSPRSMIKIGQLFKDRGVFAGQRIISEEWINESTDLQFTINVDGPEKIGYGLFWWTAQINGHKVFMAQGFAGQNIAVFPLLDLVVVTTCEWLNLKGRSTEQSMAVQELITKDVLRKYYLAKYPEAGH